jgi:hypothetical protein
MRNKKIIIFALILLLLVIGFLIRKYYLDNNIDYQVKMLKYGDTENKIKAISFLSNKKMFSIIPILIENIDNQNMAKWTDMDPKGGLVSVSCVITVELEYLTKNDLGRICYYDDVDSYKGDKVVIQKWKDWYKNEYLSWLKEQEKNKK